MKRILIICIITLAVALIAVLMYQISLQTQQPIQNSNTNVTASVSDPRNTTYVIDGETVTLKDGLAEEVLAPDSASKKVTKVFQADTTGDLNMDGKPDSVVILTQDTGGSGTFYYAAVALNSGNGYTGTNALLLGDRISPQTAYIKDVFAIVNFTDRKPDEPMTATPTVGVSKYFVVENGALKEITNGNDSIHVDAPAIAEDITSPVTVRGSARGNWFFEASFPVTLVDWDGKIIAEGQAKAKSDWMTTDFVPFEATLIFTKPSYGTRGAIIFKKDNPSGLPQNDASFEMTVYFK
jgi:hypothetical protein